MDKLHWAIDSLVLRDDTFFGYGWVFHEEKEIRQPCLEIAFDHGTATRLIDIDANKSRDDVADAYPGHAAARKSGYTIFGGFTQPADTITGLALVGHLVDGEAIRLEIPLTKIAHVKVKYSRQAFLWHAWTLIKQGKLRKLRQEYKVFSENAPEPSADGPDHIPVLLGQRQTPIVMIIDHSLGGGANCYRRQRVEEKTQQGFTVLLLSFHVPSLTHILEIHGQDRELRYEIPNISYLSRLLKRIPITEIIYNNAVSFIHPEEIPALMVALKKRGNPRLTILVHDFFIACPSFYLLDKHDSFCGIPAIGACRQCLRDQQGFTSLFASRDIDQWRMAWAGAIGAADEIRVFSNSTLQLLLRAYPDIDLSRTTVIPHKRESPPLTPVRPQHTDSLRVGVVGHIGYHKGSQIVKALADEIKRQRRDDIQIIIIGIIESDCDTSIVRQTGPYQRGQLPALIEDSGANIMLFPSIWAETFSYVVQELMEMDLPVACFDMGAPAERLRAYPKGLILDKLDAASILNELLDFHQRIYLTR